MKFCTKCGNELHDEAVICPKCGCAVEGFNPQPKKTVVKKTESCQQGSLLIKILDSAWFFMFMFGTLSLVFACVLGTIYNGQIRSYFNIDYEWALVGMIFACISSALSISLIIASIIKKQFEPKHVVNIMLSAFLLTITIITWA